MRVKVQMPNANGHSVNTTFVLINYICAAFFRNLLIPTKKIFNDSWSPFCLMLIPLDLEYSLCSDITNVSVLKLAKGPEGWW